MLGILYLALAMYIGGHVSKLFLPRLQAEPAKPAAAFMLNLPAAFVTGILLQTWITYLLAVLFSAQSDPLRYANGFAMGAFALAALGLLWRNRPRLQPQRDRLWQDRLWQDRLWQDVLSFYTAHKAALLYTAAALGFAWFLMTYTFYIADGKLYFGLSTFSDFASHLAFIRSFSYGANFPTQFPLFPDGDIRYHFMFQFLAGNLEYLGLRIDWAVNLPSILSLAACLMSLYYLAVAMTGRRLVGLLTGFLFLFRSSFAFFSFLSGFSGVGEAIVGLLTNASFIGITPNEDWGLWNQNVFANQRHFAFALTTLFVVLAVMRPLMAAPTGPWFSRSRWFSRNAWAIDNWPLCVGIGLLLGATAYWNGAVVIAALLILAGMTLFAGHRLAFAVVAALTLALTQAQSAFFVRSDASLVSPAFFFGFIADDKTLPGVARYLLALCGIFPFVMAAGLWLIRDKTYRWLGVCFLLPLVFAFTVSLTPDVTVNHKYIMITVMLGNIYIAYFLARLLRLHTQKCPRLFSVAGRFAAMLFAAVLTVSGVTDFITIVNRNVKANCLTLATDHSLTTWVLANTDPHDIFLSHMYAIHPLTQTGRPLFLGWPYYAWSAGYDTFTRNSIVNEIYSATDIDALRRMLAEQQIAYVVIGQDNRTTADYQLNEALFEAHFEKVYQSHDWENLIVYKVG